MLLLAFLTEDFLSFNFCKVFYGMCTFNVFIQITHQLAAWKEDELVKSYVPEQGWNERYHNTNEALTSVQYHFFLVILSTNFDFFNFFYVNNSWIRQ